ncbi:hypothetical protein DDF62_12985 [Caulobacter radicis]|nr:hypothetical protein DDF62_12985 [Caulobacter radicis]
MAPEANAAALANALRLPLGPGSSLRCGRDDADKKGRRASPPPFGLHPVRAPYSAPPALR